MQANKLTKLSLMLLLTSLAPWLHAVPVTDEDNAESGIAEDLIGNGVATMPTTGDISSDKSAAILAFSGYMLENDPVARIKFLLKAIDHDPSASVPLGCFIQELDKVKDRRKFENELAAIAANHPSQLRLNMAAAFLMSASQNHEQVIKLFRAVRRNVKVNSLSEQDLPFFINLISIVGKSYLVTKDFNDGVEVFQDLIGEKRLRNNLKVLGFAVLFFTAASEKASDESGWFSTSTRKRAAREREICLDRIGELCFRQYYDPLELGLTLDLCKQNKEIRRGSDMLYSLLLSKPDDLKTRLFLAVFYSGAGRDEEAFRVWREIVRKEPTNLKFSLELAKAAEKAGRFKIAASAYRNYLRGAPADKATLSRMALAALRGGEYNEALETASTLTDNPLAYYIAALACRQLKQYRQSAEWLEKTEKLAKKTKAEAMLDKEFYLTLAHAWERGGDKNKAEAVLKEVLARFPDDPTVNNFLGYMWAENGIKLKDARRHIEKALAKEPDNPAINDSMAWVLYRSGHFAEAERYIRKALQACGKIPDAVIIAHAGDIYSAVGKLQEAGQCWQKALLLYAPDDEINRSELKAKLDKLKTVGSQARKS